MGCRCNELKVALTAINAHLLMPPRRQIEHPGAQLIFLGSMP